MSRNKRMNMEADTDGVVLEFYGPRNADGVQEVVATVMRDARTLPQQYHGYMLQRCYAELVAQRLDDGDFATVEKELWQSLVKGEWDQHRRPGFQRSEPSDLALAISKVWGQPAHEVEDRLQNELVTDENGEPLLDERGRRQRRFTATNIKAMLARPSSAPIREELARIAAERAKREAREAREARNAANEPEDEQEASLAALFGAAPIAQHKAA